MARQSEENDKSPTHTILTPGTMIDQYRIVDKIGAGGMGEVYLAEDTRLDRTVALKFLPSHVSDDEEFRTRFRREAQAAAKIDHPNIVAIHEIGEYRGRPYFAMAHVINKTLKKYVSDSQLSIDDILDLAIQICEGLLAAHERGVIHRDIKPSNILVDSTGRVRIVDFGLAAVMGTERLTRTGSTMGTVGYMSPEQVHGENVDGRSDLFSFGVLLYEMITGVHPFVADNEARTLHAILNIAPQPIAMSAKDVPSGLQNIVDRLFAKNPGKRYQSARDVISEIKMLRSSPRRPGKDTPPLPSVAVLPFANLSADPDQDYFCDGMAEEIITALTQIENLRVIARTSAFAFKGKNEDIREIGRKLDVTALLEGSVRKAGNKLRITAQLINVSDGSHLWSKRFDRELEDVFAIQDEIAQMVVGELKSKLISQHDEALVRTKTHNLEAYSLFLKGRYYWHQLTPEGWEKSLDCYQRAIDIDPDYAMPYVWTAIWYQSQAYWGEMVPEEASSKTIQALEKALTLDPSIPDLYNVQAVWQFSYNWDWEAAERAFERSLELAPVVALAHTNYSLFLTIRQRFEEAMVHAKIAKKLDPLSTMVGTWSALPALNAGDYDTAIGILESTIKLEPTHWQPYLHLGMALLAQSKYDDALAALNTSLEYSGGAPIVLMMLSVSYYLVGEIARADEYLETLHRRSKQAYISAMFFAWISIARGDIDQGVNWLEEAKRRHDPWLSFAAWPRAVLKITDPRIDDVLRSIGLPASSSDKNDG